MAIFSTKGDLAAQEIGPGTRQEPRFVEAPLLWALVHRARLLLLLQGFPLQQKQQKLKKCCKALLQAHAVRRQRG